MKQWPQRPLLIISANKSSYKMIEKNLFFAEVNHSIPLYRYLLPHSPEPGFPD